MLHQVVLLLGSNIDPRDQYLQSSLDLINKEIGILISISSVFETAPWGNFDQNFFLNQAIIIETEFEPQKVLELCQSIEQKLERKREIHWGPRTIDIDIIYYDDFLVNENDLIIPHPSLQDRRFVLEPLVEILPDFIHPVLKFNHLQLLENCSDHEKVVLWSK